MLQARRENKNTKRNDESTVENLKYNSGQWGEGGRGGADGRGCIGRNNPHNLPDCSKDVKIGKINLNQIFQSLPLRSGVLTTTLRRHVRCSNSHVQSQCFTKLSESCMAENVSSEWSNMIELSHIFLRQ